MKGIAIISLAAVCLVASASSAQTLSSAPATEPATAASLPAGTAASGASTTSSAPAGVILGEYAEIIRICKLSDSQRAELVERVWQMQQEMAGFWKDKQDKLVQLRKDMTQAQDAGDIRKFASLQDEFRGLIESGYKPLRLKHEKAIMAILTPQQRLTWEAASVDRVLAPYAKLGLSEDQKQKLQSVRDQSAKELSALDDPCDFGAQWAIFRKALWQAYDDILTQEQRDQAPSPSAVGRMLMTPSTASAPALETAPATSPATAPESAPATVPASMPSAT